MIKFGDVFRYKEQDYVFLAKTPEILFAAQILEKEDSDDFIRARNVIERKQSVKSSNLAYCFVILRTAEFKKRIAHLANTGQDELVFDQFLCTLDPEDLKEIQREILADGSPVPRGLKELVKDIEIK